MLDSYLYNNGQYFNVGTLPNGIYQVRATASDLTPIQTHHFSLLDAKKAFELGQDATACIKVTLSTKGLN